MSQHWNVQPEVSRSRYKPHAVTVAGPGLDNLVQGICEDLADSILDGDTRADAWGDYLVAVVNLRVVEADGADAGTRKRFEDAVADAYAALVPELPNAMRLIAAEARLLAGQLDEACGRVGIEGRRPV